MSTIGTVIARFDVLLSLWALWFSLARIGTAQMQYEEGVWVSYTNFHQVNDIAVGIDYIYLATPGGVLRYQRYKHLWDDPWVIVRGLEGSIDLRSAGNVDYLAETNDVAVLTSRGAFLYDPTAEYWVSTDHTFDAVQQTQLNQAFFIDRPGPTVSGRSFFNQGNEAIMDSDLRRYQLGAFADDGWGNWWISVEGVGVMQMDSRTLRGNLWELGLFGSDVRTLARGQGWTVLAGHNREKGITFWKPKDNLWDHLEPKYTAGFESAWINDLAVTGRWLLAATDYGVAQIDLKNGSCRTWTVFDGLWSNQTLSVAADKDTVWIGTEDGLNVLYLSRGPVKRIELESLKNQPCYRLAVDGQAVWVGGEIGLFRLERATGVGEYMGLEGGVGGPVFALRSTEDEIWVGRYTGLEVVDKQSLKQEGYPAQAFFGGAQINAVLPVDSLVYFGTNQGLWKFDRFRNRWHQYTEFDGLLDNRVNAILQDGDYLLLGTSAGVTKFFWNDPSRAD